MLRILLVLCMIVPLFAVEESKVDPTTPHRIQGSVDPETGKVETLQIWDINYAVDAVGNKVAIGERSKTLKRSDAPALFAAIDAEMAKTSQRDAAEKAKKAAQAAAEAAAKAAADAKAAEAVKP